MALTPEQMQLLQQYMQKNRTPQQPGMQAQQFQAQPVQPSGSTGAGIASLLGGLGKFFDTPAVQGPVQPGAAPLSQGEPSALTRFASALDPQSTLQQQIIQQQQMAPKIDTQSILLALKKAGIM